MRSVLPLSLVRLTGKPASTAAKRTSALPSRAASNMRRANSSVAGGSEFTSIARVPDSVVIVLAGLALSILRCKIGQKIVRSQGKCTIFIFRQDGKSYVNLAN